MQNLPLNIAGLVVFEPRVHGDGRGAFFESYNASVFRDLGVEAVFVQDNHAISRAAGVVRGLHFQTPPYAQGKLVRVVRGSILDVAVDIRLGSPTYGQHAAVELSEDNRRQLWIPPGFAHGYCTTEPNTEVLYKVTNFHSAEHDKGLSWNDRTLSIKWPVIEKDAILSDKDRKHPTIAELPAYFTYEI